MSVTNPRTSRLEDAELTAFGELLGDGVPEPVRVAMANFGVTVESAEAAQITWWPGDNLTVRYHAHLSGAVEGRRDIVAVTGSGRIDTPLWVEADGAEVGVWMVPHDPGLPGLASALDPETAARLLCDLGAESHSVDVRLRAYRPGRRAVAEVAGSSASVYLKAVPPQKAKRLHKIHLQLKSILPVPATLGYDPDRGVLAMQALSGLTLRHTLNRPGASLPSPASVAAIPELLPEPVSSRTIPSPLERLDDAVIVLRHILPEEAERLEALVASVGPETVDELVPVHGDYYEAQLLVNSGAVTAVVDIDTFGWGRAGDDPATMLGHLSVWQDAASDPERVRLYSRRLLAEWDSRLDPVDLRRRAAAVVAGLAVGPFRVQGADWPRHVSRRIALAERWARSANLVDERDLITAS